MKRYLRFVPALAWASLIFFLSSQPRLPDLPVTFDGIDKALHALFFGILCSLVIFGVGHRGKKALIAGVVATMCYGAFDEIHQMFVPNRTPDIFDWAADSTGATLAALILRKRSAMITTYRGTTPQLGRDVFVAPSADVIGRVVLGDHASVWYGCVLRGDVGNITVGPRTNIQDLSVIHITTDTFDTTIGADVTVGHRAVLHGCTVEDLSLIGMGAILLDGSHVEPECIIGAGALVSPGTRIPRGSLALGSPARVVRPLKETELEQLRHSAAHYVDLARHHLSI